MWTIEGARVFCREKLAVFGVSLGVPVTINRRLKSALGCVRYIDNDPIRIEFSDMLFTTCKDESIQQIMMHECCHYAAAILTGERHGHDAYFKKLCSTLGCTLDGYNGDIERTVSNSEIYRYEVKCKNCNNVVFYHRAGKVIQHIEDYRCGNCGGGPLYVVKNW